jgi:thiamine biosynthesis lipoprotein
MPLEETLPLTPATAQWPVWSTTARIVLTDAERLESAREIATRRLALVDAACSRFRADSELMTLPAGRPVLVSEQLAELVRAALDAAAATDGLVNPTVGALLAGLGYDRDWAEMADMATERPARPASRVRVRQVPSWRQVRLEGRQLTVPVGVQLDLGATGKAFTADLIAAQIAGELAVGVLVALGGDIATAGPEPEGGWIVLVQDQPGDPSITVRLAPQSAIATSSTQSRRWQAGGHQMHHIVDPRSAAPAKVVWRSATVAAPSCAAANALSTAALILGLDAPGWLQQQGRAARLVSTTGEVVTIAGFPTVKAAETEESRNR